MAGRSHHRRFGKAAGSPPTVVSTPTAVFLSFGRKREKVGGKKRESLRTAKEKTPSASATRKSGVLFRLILQHHSFTLPLNGLAAGSVLKEAAGTAALRLPFRNVVPTLPPDVLRSAGRPHPSSRFARIHPPRKRGGQGGFGLAAALAVVRLPCRDVCAKKVAHGATATILHFRSAAVPRVSVHCALCTSVDC